MANFTIYTMSDGTDVKLKLNAESIVKLEEKLGDSIQAKLAELTKLSIAAEFIAAACDGGKTTAYAIYDDIIERGQTLEEYHKVIYNLLVSAGFLKAAEVERNLSLNAAWDKAEQVSHEVKMKKLKQKTEELQTELTAEPTAEPLTMSAEISE